MDMTNKKIQEFSKRKCFSNFAPNLDFLLENKLIVKDDVILEIGSGKGFILNYLKNKGYNIVGIEINEGYISNAKKDYGEDLPIYKVSGIKTKFKDNTFDKIISFDVLEHIPETDLHLNEIYRILKNKGEYCFGIPNKITDMPFCIYVNRSFTAHTKPGSHCSLHTYWSIRKRLNKNNFCCKFYDQSQNSEWLHNKIQVFFGKIGLFIFKIINVDKWPIWVKPTLYVVASKNTAKLNK